MKNFARYALAATALVAILPAAQANAATLVVSVAGGQGFDDFGGTGNTVRTYNVGAGSTITGVSYSVNITARGASWLSEATLAFTNSLLSNGVFLSPGFGVDNAGTATFTSSADLVALGLSFVDGALPDSIWNRHGNVHLLAGGIGRAGTGNLGDDDRRLRHGRWRDAQPSSQEHGQLRLIRLPA